MEYNATGFPKCMTKEDVADLLRTKCGWKVLVIKPIQDKFDRSKNFWMLKADEPPTKRYFTIQTSTHAEPTVIVINKKTEKVEVEKSENKAPKQINNFINTSVKEK